MFIPRRLLFGYQQKRKDTYHMSDLEKELPEIPLPKPKKKVKNQSQAVS